MNFSLTNEGSNEILRQFYGMNSQSLITFAFLINNIFRRKIINIGTFHSSSLFKRKGYPTNLAIVLFILKLC